jgi:hypothetical protein
MTLFVGEAWYERPMHFGDCMVNIIPGQHSDKRSAQPTTSIGSRSNHMNSFFGDALESQVSEVLGNGGLSNAKAEVLQVDAAGSGAIAIPSRFHGFRK